MPEGFPERRDRRLPARLHRRRGRRRRLSSHPPGRRQSHHRLPGPSARPAVRQRPERGHGRALRQGHRPRKRQGRLHAPLRRGERHDGRLRHRRRAHTSRCRYGLRDALPGDRQHHPAIPGRRLDEPGRLPRGGQPRRTLGQGRPVPGGVHRGEQPVRHGHLRRAHDGHDGPRRQVQRLRHREREGGRHGPRSRAGGCRAGDGTGPGDRPAVCRRGADLPDGAARGGGLLREVPHQRRGQGVAPKGPDRPCWSRSSSTPKR